ncbi:MAG: LPXTG cell wall anchor domain-containing protein, partial [Clostridia bacterium]|nr:LPXTG cell wall anchor domain-containing protein [Clostridia bacterium]
DSPSTGESVLLISVSAVLLILAAFGVVFAIRRRRAQGE